MLYKLNFSALLPTPMRTTPNTNAKGGSLARVEENRRNLEELDRVNFGPKHNGLNRVDPHARRALSWVDSPQMSIYRPSLTLDFIQNLAQFLVKSLGPFMNQNP